MRRGNHWPGQEPWALGPRVSVKAETVSSCLQRKVVEQLCERFLGDSGGRSRSALYVCADEEDLTLHCPLHISRTGV